MPSAAKNNIICHLSSQPCPASIYKTARRMSIEQLLRRNKHDNVCYCLLLTSSSWSFSFRTGQSLTVTLWRHVNRPSFWVSFTAYRPWEIDTIIANSAEIDDSDIYFCMNSSEEELSWLYTNVGISVIIATMFHLLYRSVSIIVTYLPGIKRWGSKYLSSLHFAKW